MPENFVNSQKATNFAPVNERSTTPSIGKGDILKNCLMV